MTIQNWIKSIICKNHCYISPLRPLTKVFLWNQYDRESQRSCIAGSSRRWPAERVGPNCALDQGSKHPQKKGHNGVGKDGSDAADEEPLGDVNPHPRPDHPPDYLHRPIWSVQQVTTTHLSIVSPKPIIWWKWHNLVGNVHARLNLSRDWWTI